MEKILPKFPLLDRLDDVAVRGGDESDVDMQLLCAADAGEGAVLEKPQQLRLERPARVANLVQKNGPPVRLLDQSPLGAVRPVNAPRSYPNSSLSRRVSGITAQLRRTYGFATRRLRLCRAPAINSLPVPLSPRISTVASVGATVWISCLSSRIFGASPIRCSIR